MRILGHVEDAMPKARGKFRWHIMLRGVGRTALHQCAGLLLEAADNISKNSGVSIRMDVDPLNLL